MSLRSELEATSKFLDSARDFPDVYASAKVAQFKRACELCEQRAWTVQEAGEALMFLKSACIWTSDEQCDLADRIQKHMGSVPALGASRQSLQDFSSLPMYLSEGMWAKLLSPNLSDMGKVILLAEHAARLGLRAPTETTSQFLTSLLLNLPGCQMDSSSPIALHKAFVTVKHQLKTTLNLAGGLPSDQPVLEKLPAHLGRISFSCYFYYHF